MRGKKFISLTLSTMLCLQLLPTASFAAAPATDTGNAGLIAEGDYAIAGNGVRGTFYAGGATNTTPGRADNHSVPHRGIWAHPDEQAFSIGRASGWRAGGSGLQPYFM